MWGTGLLEPGTKRVGTTRREETCKAGDRGGVLRRAPKKVKGEELPTGGSPSPESPLLVWTARGGPQGVEKGGGEVRWPVLAGAAPLAPGSVSIPSFCRETEMSQRRLMDQKRCQGRDPER